MKLRWMIGSSLLFISLKAAAITPTWTGAVSTIWSNNGNWAAPATAPGNSPAPFDTAIFPGSAVRTTAANNGTITLNAIQFNAGSTVYTITNNAAASNMTLAGSGIINNSGQTQLLNNARNLTFQNSADAGANIIITNNSGGVLSFQGNATANSATIVNNGSGNINISGVTAVGGLTIGSLSGGGTINLGSRNLSINDLNTSTTISGVISGVGGQLTKTGTGTLTLTGNNTYSGITTIANGFLSIGNGGTSGNVAGNIQNNTVLIFNRSNTATYAGVISGAGSVTKLGAGTLIFTGNNVYTGGTTISTGILQIGNNTTTGSIVGDVLNNAVIRFSRSDNITYAGVISGSGSLTKLNAGTLTLTGNNTYVGGTTITGGTLELGNGGTSGSVVGAIVDNAALRFNRTDPVTFGGVISGTGTVTKVNTNTLTLTGNNTYTGITTISGGTLQIGNGGTTGAIIRNIVNNAALIFNRSDNVTYDRVISGVGTVTKLGAGVLTFSGNNTYTGGTTISAGTLQIGAGGTTGNVVGNITDNAVLVFNRSNNLTYAGVISGSGSMTQQGTGRLTLTGTNTYTGGTTIAHGTLRIGNNNVTGSIVGDVINNAALQFFRSNSLTFGGQISGSGTLTKLGAGVLTLTGNNTYTGDTTITTGVLQIGNGGTTGSIVSDIIDNAALRFNRSDTLTYGGIISGTGTLTQLGPGTLILTGNNTFTGTTTISAGTLQLGNGGTTGIVVGPIVDNGILAFNHSNTVEINTPISGTGSLNQLGPGLLILNAINTYAGPTNVIDGTLFIGDDDHQGASVAGNVNVDPAGMLGGFGTVEGSIFNRGTISPGGSNLGVLKVANNFFQFSTGDFLIEVDRFGGKDLLAVDGIASLDGIIRIDALDNGFLRFHPYTILTADGGVTGRFSNTDINGIFNQGFLSGQVFYLPNSVDFIVDFNAAAFLNAAQTPNQISVANYLLKTGGTPPIKLLISMIFTDEEFRRAMDEISGATYANQQLTVGQIDKWFQKQLSDRFSIFPGCRHTSPCCSNCDCSNAISFWGATYGSNGVLKAGEVSGLDTSFGGVVLGMETANSKRWGMGLAFGYDYFQGDATSRERSDYDGVLYQLGLYARYQVGCFLVGASVDGGKSRVSTTRYIRGGRSIVTPKSNYDARITSEQIQASYNININRQFSFQPFVGLINQAIDRDVITETSANGFDLKINPNRYHSRRGQLGARVELTNELIRPFISASWEHEYADRKGEFDANIIGLDGTFHIVGTETGTNTGTLQAGILLEKKKNFMITLQYEGRVARAWGENGAKLQATINF